MTNIIALDIGEVCVKLCPAKILAYFGWQSMSDISKEAMRSFNEFERGFLSVEEFCDKMREELSKNLSNDEIIDGWNSLLGEDYPGMNEVVEELVGLGYRFVFMSNISEPHALFVRRNLQFSHLVNGEIFSFEVGAQKPDGAIYEAFEQKYGKPCFYLDDKEENIVAGKDFGWEGHVFTGADAFRRDFMLRVHAKRND